MDSSDQLQLVWQFLIALTKAALSLGVILASAVVVLFGALIVYTLAFDWWARRRPRPYNWQAEAPEFETPMGRERLAYEKRRAA